MSDQPICYHAHRRSMWEGPLPSMGHLIVTCEDCGATVKAPYNTPLPDLPPMPYPAEVYREAVAGRGDTP